jgi:adenylate cyclase
MTYVSTGQMEKALDSNRQTLQRAERVLAENSSDTYALMCWVLALARLGEVERAKQGAVRVKAVDPDDPRRIQHSLRNGQPRRSRDGARHARVLSSPGDAAVFSVWMRQDSDLDSLREIPRFERVMSDLEDRAAAASKPPY